MNLIPRRWKLESLVCGLRGHVAPARTVAHLRDGDIHVGVEGPQPHERFSRCLRCDAWLPGLDPDHPSREDLGDLGEIVLPRRGEVLRQALVMRLIAIDKAVHAVGFAIAFAALSMNRPAALEASPPVGPRSVASRVNCFLTSSHSTGTAVRSSGIVAPSAILGPLGWSSAP